nr:hypothetical protein [Tanacetum cinerariifolium]
PDLRNNKWYQILVRSFDQEKNNIQAQQKKKMVKSSTSSENKPCCSKACKKNTDNPNSKIIELTNKLNDSKNMMYHSKLGLSQVKARLVEFKNQEIKFCEKIRGLEFKDMSWTGLPEFADNTITDYSRPLPAIESTSDDLQNKSSSASENGESTRSILSKPEIKFVKPTDSSTVAKTDKKESVRKPTIKYAEMYRRTSKSPNVKGNQRN